MVGTISVERPSLSQVLLKAPGRAAEEKLLFSRKVLGGTRMVI